jgi:hypothetical protein
MWLRLFAPWKRFGLIFLGDNRGFTTEGDDRSLSPSTVTSRIKSFVHFQEGTHDLLDYRAKSDLSHDVFGHTDEAQPSLSVTPWGGEISMKVSASNPIVPSPPIDATLSFKTMRIGQQVCYSGDLVGDGFPNAEVFVERNGVRTMLRTYQTPGDPETGPAEYLFGDNRRPMGHFSRCF